MKDAFLVLKSFGSIGPFLGYQLLVDLNYSDYLDFDEDSFVVAGPGARRGLRKCFADPGDLSPSDLIRYVHDQQGHAFSDRGLEWDGLFGRRLHLIDVQNLFCEVDKYTRVAHPELCERVPGTRIKQLYSPLPNALTAWFPPKWHLNHKVHVGRHEAIRGRLGPVLRGGDASPLGQS